MSSRKNGHTLVPPALPTDPPLQEHAQSAVHIM